MQPIFIFGTRTRQEEIGGGEFHCPNCETTRRYTHKRARNYFSMYFVPLIPFGEGQEYIQCDTCGMAFEPAVLTMKPKRKILPLAQQLNTLEQRLISGTPIEYALADLTAAGLDRDLARQNIERLIGTARVSCPTCGLTYAAGVSACTEDGTPL